MTLLLQLVAVWSVLSVLVAVGCSLLFRGAATGAERSARPVEAKTSRHLAA